ncbi:MAG: fructose-6-phosphate aldolase [Deferribacteraceae bacterium]|jgi:transaldolase|nr:fructose-6-phosphate aldolase [Deferribacteraceae bacterium]
MKLFLDTADIEEIRQAADLGVIDGVTTNPTLIAKEKKDFKSVIRKICEIIDGPVSAEVTSTTSQEMVDEAYTLSKIHENVVIKIPLTKDGLVAASKLAEKEVPVNMTLIFSPNQALLACKAGARYVSPFVGRLDDIGHDGVLIASQCQDIINTYDFDAEVIAASIRHPMHVFHCAQEGVDIATVPFKVLMQMMKHPLTDNGLEQFMRDWKSAQS